MVEIIRLRATVGASAVESAIGELNCPERERIVVLEIFGYTAAAGVIKGFFKQRKLDELDSLAMPTALARVVKNLEMVSGDKYSFVGTDTSAGANVMIVGLVIDRTTVA
jgi:hypothetical protein